MFHGLDDFYRSDEWRGLLAQIKLARPDLICEHCGRPIVKPYDCIGHHKTQLTEANVHDYTISLNPDNVALVHHTCHNEIHERYGFNRREVFLVYGSPLSGKTSYVESVRMPGDLILDMDSIWECVSGCPRYVKPAKLNAVVFAVRDSLIDAVRVRKGQWSRAYIIGGYPLVSERERLAKGLGAREIFIDSSRSECLARLDADKDRDKEAWARFIDEWWRLYTPTPGGASI